jgi:hypothetical protein
LKKSNYSTSRICRPASSTVGPISDSAQLQDGEGYDTLKPTYSIWLLGETLRPKLKEAIHHFRLRDEQGRSLLDHGGIWLKVLWQ